MIISNELQAGIVMSFKKILEIMQDRGNAAMQELSNTIQDELREMQKNQG